MAIFEETSQIFSSKTLGTTLSGSSGADRVADRLLAFGITFDNLTATTPTVSLNKPAGETNDWTIVYHDSPQSGAAAGVRGAIAVIETTVSWTAHTITMTFSGSITAKAAVFKMFSGASATQRAAAASSTGAGAKSSSASGQVGDLALILGSSEQPSDGTTPDWTSSDETVTSQVKSGTTGGSGVTNVTAAFAYAELGTAGARTFTLANVTDGGAIVWVLQPAGAPGVALPPILVMPPRTY